MDNRKFEDRFQVNINFSIAYTVCKIADKKTAYNEGHQY